PEVGGEHPTEVLLGRARRRAIVVGQVEVGYAEVEGAPADLPLHGEGPIVAEVVPQPEGDCGKAQSAASASTVEHRVVSVAGRLIGHAGQGTGGGAQQGGGNGCVHTGPA